MGVSIGLKEKNPKVKIYIVEPANSAVIPAKPVPAKAGTCALGACTCEACTCEGR